MHEASVVEAAADDEDVGLQGDTISLRVREVSRKT
jgi:hypothetical protein